MQPNDQSDDRSLTVPQRDDTTAPRPVDREAAAQLMREQIDRIYDQPAQTPAQAPAAHTYERSHDDTKAHEGAGNEWHRYHSAWQQYYQQYYERYYLQQLAANRTRVSSEPKQLENTTHNPFPVKADEPVQGETVTKDQAIHEIRDDLLKKVKTHAETVRKSRHFWPVISALVVMLLFLGLQYNRVLVAQVKAYVSPGAVDPQNIIVDPTTDTKVGPEPKLIIPKINVDAPVVYGVTSLADAPVQSALKNGVVHYPIPGANSLPGHKGNTVILGHSSNDVFDDGNYKFIFVQLDKLQIGDTFYINYESVRYTYAVTKKEIIDPTEVSKLVVNGETPMATLVTCTPPGTALKRLVVYAEQISPDPTKAADSAATGTSDTATSIPGNSPTLLERLFGN